MNKVIILIIVIMVLSVLSYWISNTGSDKKKLAGEGDDCSEENECESPLECNAEKICRPINFKIPEIYDIGLYCNDDLLQNCLDKNSEEWCKTNCYDFTSDRVCIDNGNNGTLVTDKSILTANDCLSTDKTHYGGQNTYSRSECFGGATPICAGILKTYREME